MKKNKKASQRTRPNGYIHFVLVSKVVKFTFCELFKGYFGFSEHEKILIFPLRTWKYPFNLDSTGNLPHSYWAKYTNPEEFKITSHVLDHSAPGLVSIVVVLRNPVRGQCFASGTAARVLKVQFTRKRLTTYVANNLIAFFWPRKVNRCRFHDQQASCTFYMMTSYARIITCSVFWGILKA